MEDALLQRIDERLVSLIDRWKHLEVKVDLLINQMNNIHNRVSLLEDNDEDNDKEIDKLKIVVNQLNGDLLKLHGELESLERDIKQQSNWIMKGFDFVSKLLWVVVAAWLLFKLGIQAPSVP
jgi:chromosome segregation ATPase